jgi:hypothetical protein
MSTESSPNRNTERAPAKTTQQETTQRGSGPEAPPEAPVAKETEKPAEENIKPSAPGETGTTPGTNWKQ